jgi:hypothetical protein
MTKHAHSADEEFERSTQLQILEYEHANLRSGRFTPHDAKTRLFLKHCFGAFNGLDAPGVERGGSVSDEAVKAAIEKLVSTEARIAWVKERVKTFPSTHAARSSRGLTALTRTA